MIPRTKTTPEGRCKKEADEFAGNKVEIN